MAMPLQSHNGHSEKDNGELGGQYGLSELSSHGGRVEEKLTGHSTAIMPKMRLLHDPDVTFEEYMYYAERSRAQEDALANQHKKAGISLRSIFLPSTTNKGPVSGPGANGPWQAALELNLSDPGVRATITDEEWTNASRALRTASAAACFYLITTDILGPFGVGFALGTMGWGEGFGFYTLFGIFTGFSGYLLWKVFMNIDSFEFPAKNYGDLAYRIYGKYFRWLVNFGQGLQLTLSVGAIIMSNGQSISQVSKFHLCYSVCCLIWALVGFLMGQVRTLARFTWLANWSVFINLLIMFISMGVVAHSEPNYAAAQAGSSGATLGGSLVTQLADGSYPPITRFSTVPPSDNGFIGSLIGLMQGVYAYAGAQLFIEFMAELQRPRDFLKVMWGSQFFIYAVYMIYGSYIYYFQGQYANQIAYQGISPYGWQTVCNILAVISGIIAATLYGNIGIKVIYNNILIDIFNFPPLTTKKGKIGWAVIVPVFWSVAFILASAIPDFNGLTSLTAALFFVQFTYTFPALLSLGFFVQREAMKGEPPFDPATGRLQRQDSGLKRLARGFMGRYWWLCILLTLYTLASLVVSALGCYSAIMALIAAFKTPQVTAFVCRSPLEG